MTAFSKGVVLLKQYKDVLRATRGGDIARWLIAGKQPNNLGISQDDKNDKS